MVLAHYKLLRLRAVLGTTSTGEGVVARRQRDGFSVGTIDLGPKEKVGREPLRSVESPFRRRERFTQRVRATALLDVDPYPAFKNLPYDVKPYWTVERSRIGNTREVHAELVVNGEAVAQQNVLADGKNHDVSFDVPISRSSWVAMRILPSAHTNPIFVMVGSKPIRASRASAEWDQTAVRQCWTQKSARISPAEQAAARAAYNHADEVYKQLESESSR